ncbi:hypothetical protein JZ968_10090 [Riemerella anatipestifer]|uniref:hypothetical protein n=1 Tax=Riemerella anatipestifer TaxID=34085 RepID=UPI00129EED2E|nr:hypothetical protein [Riemerella anatipestifer]MRM84912.1 hypothetical protein [Riemerella anatipestifer]
MSVKNRLKTFIKSQGTTISSFEKGINVSNGYVNSISKGIGGEVLLNILEKSPELNIDWLLTGKGEMLKTETKNNQKIKGDGNIMAGIGSNIETVQDNKQTILQLKKEIKELNKRLLEKDEQINKLINILSNGK